MNFNFIEWIAFAPRILCCVALNAFISTSVIAGDPPFPNELLYPNVVPPTKQFGTFGNELGAFSEPRGACFISPDRLAVADNGNRRVQIVSVDGFGVDQWDTKSLGDSKGFVSVTGIACSEGRVAVVDAGTNEVILLSETGKLSARFGGFGSKLGQLNEPMAVAVGEDEIVVADTGNNRIQIFTLDGKPKLEFGSFGRGDGEFNHPIGVSIDSEGSIYVADAWNNRLQKFTAKGEHIISWGEWGSHAGLFATPSSVVAVGMHVYVTDLTNHRIQTFDLHGNFLFQWGRHPVLGHEGNGRTHYPWALAVDAQEKRFALIEPVENRIQIFEKLEVAKAKNVNDSAWWDKATRFHYGSRSEIGANILTVSEPDTHSVLVFDISKDTPFLISRLGGRGTALGKLIEPSGMAIDAERGEVLVTDAGNLRLQTLALVKAPSGIAELESLTSAEGYFTDLGKAVSANITIFQNVPPPKDEKVNVEKVEKFGSILSSRPLSLSLSDTETLIYPGALKRALDGEVYLYDQAKARILIIKNGSIRKTFGGYGTEPGKFRSVHNMSFSRDQSKIFVVDPYNFRVQIFDRDGNYIKSFGKPGHADDEFSSIFGITSGIDGYIYISDETKHCIYKYTESGELVLRWSRWGTEPGELYKPKGISQDKNGKLYVLSFGNHRGEMYSPDGKHLGSFGLADPVTQRGREVSEILSSRPTYSVSAKKLFDRDATDLINGTLAEVISPGSISITSNAEKYKVLVTSSSPLSNVDEPKTLKVRVLSASSGKPVDVELVFDAVMPAHSHGLTTQPKIKKIKKGLFEIEGVSLSMPGMWEMYFDIRDRLYSERAQAAIYVR